MKVSSNIFKKASRFSSVFLFAFSEIPREYSAVSHNRFAFTPLVLFISAGTRKAFALLAFPSPSRVSSIRRKFPLESMTTMKGISRIGFTLIVFAE
jgi:hypothetical protein